MILSAPHLKDKTRELGKNPRINWIRIVRIVESSKK